MGGLVKEAATTQLGNGLGGEVTKIGGKIFITLKVTMAKTDGHEELKSGLMQMTRFQTEYDQQAGFNVSIDGTDLKLPFYWSHLIDQAEDIMFFGPLHQGSRNFYRHLRSRDDEFSLFHVFKHLAVEYRGDVLASTQLYGAYYRRLSEIKHNQISQSYDAGESAILKRMTDTTLAQKIFIGMFDGLCKNEFTLALTEYNDYGVEILRFEDQPANTFDPSAPPSLLKVSTKIPGPSKNDNRTPDVS